MCTGWGVTDFVGLPRRGLLKPFSLGVPLRSRWLQEDPGLVISSLANRLASANICFSGLPPFAGGGNTLGSFLLMVGMTIVKLSSSSIPYMPVSADMACSSGGRLERVAPRSAALPVVVSFGITIVKSSVICDTDVSS